MPLTFEFIIPEGWLRIARRFNAGREVRESPVPKGPLNGFGVPASAGGTVNFAHAAINRKRHPAEAGTPNPFSRPCGTYSTQQPNPALKRRAIFVGPSGTRRLPPTKS